MHSKKTVLLLSIFCGFLCSFLLMLAAPFLTGNYGAQLIAGDPKANSELPTTLNMMHAAMDGTNPVVGNLTSFGWWIAVTMLGIIATAVFFKVLRRFV